MFLYVFINIFECNQQHYLMMRRPKFTRYCCNNNQYFIFDNMCTEWLLRALDVILSVNKRATCPFASLLVTAIYITRTTNSPTSILPFWNISAFIFLRVRTEACLWLLYLYPVQLSQDILSLGWNVSLYPILISMCCTTYKIIYFRYILQYRPRSS